MIAPRPLPPFALLSRYAADGGYADCFATELPGDYSHAEYVAAFYTTWLFKLERLVLATLVFKPSTDAQADQLGRGERNAFAAWTVEARSPDQLLVRDYQGKTCSWLMIERLDGVTRLYFGTGIVPLNDGATGTRRLSAFFRGLLPFHQRYARALLRAARSRLISARS